MANQTESKPADVWQGDAAQQVETSAILDAIQQVTAIVSAAAQELAQIAESMPARPSVPAGLVVAGTEVNTWDDPFSEKVPTANPPIATPFVVTPVSPALPLLRTSIVEPQPAPRRYAPGTPEFRYWVAVEALNRGISFWGTLLPAGTTWSTSNPMRVTLVDLPDQLNANYSRPFGLRFYRQKVAGFDICASESPDVVCHELGHAVLDALRPELFNAADTETAAFHESFGDMSAILCALQVQSLRRQVIADTGGRLNTSSSLSRLAEQLGWGLRQILSPGAVEDDCLRNASNRFFYRRPDLLPPEADASMLSTEEHSFSRVFTGAFLDALARMFTAATTRDEDTLLAVSRNLGQLLIDAVHGAPVTADYMSQVAAALVQADQARFGGRNRAALTGAFLEHGLLSIGSALALTNAPTPAALHPAQSMAGLDGAGSPMIFTYDDRRADVAFSLGFGQTPELERRSISIGGAIALDVHAAHEQPRFDVRPTTFGIQGGRAIDFQGAAQSFVEGLILRRQVDLGPGIGFANDVSRKDSSRVTHAVVAEDGKSVLKRNHFACRCHRGAPRIPGIA